MTQGAEHEEKKTVCRRGRGAEYDKRRKGGRESIESNAERQGYHVLTAVRVYKPVTGSRRSRHNAARVAYFRSEKYGIRDREAYGDGKEQIREKRFLRRVQAER